METSGWRELCKLTNSWNESVSYRFCVSEISTYGVAIHDFDILSVLLIFILIISLCWLSETLGVTSFQFVVGP